VCSGLDGNSERKLDRRSSLPLAASEKTEIPSKLQDESFNTRGPWDMLKSANMNVASSFSENLVTTEPTCSTHAKVLPLIEANIDGGGAARQSSFKSAIPRKKRSILSDQGPLPLPQKSYTVEFDASMPLGFYCMTEERCSGEVCRIVSVYPYGGQCQRDRRIQCGTIVVTATLTGLSQPISSHQMLESLYSHALFNKSGSLHVEFINTEVTLDFGVQQATTCSLGNADWTSVGKWKGGHSAG
jgi:hypothetical protein